MGCRGVVGQRPVSVGGKFGQWELSQQDPREEAGARSVYWGERVQSVIGKETAQVTKRPKTKENLNLKADKRHQVQGLGRGEDGEFVKTL